MNKKKLKVNIIPLKEEIDLEVFEEEIEEIIMGDMGEN